MPTAAWTTCAQFHGWPLSTDLEESWMKSVIMGDDAKKCGWPSVAKRAVSAGGAAKVWRPCGCASQAPAQRNASLTPKASSRDCTAATS